MVSKQSVIDIVRSDLGNTPKSEVCVAIVEYVLDPANKNISHLTYSSLRKVANREASDTEFFEAIQYLCGEHVNLLESKFELIQGVSAFDVPKADVKSAQQSGIFIHPETGEAVSDYKKCLFVYFVPTHLSSQIAS
ncbi:MAG: hypothetical protein DCF25_13700 [Leptolyngbya foveolarum]|uniref:Uncharacterized protein n=1 Tax=Leptolyngbya foveolarum TaxID=47253 RepID=A0A2W4U8F9_9CYAN|nr:MAG: hypothetical protein DCF25_13700 [Leptolyngbya foveolarum]